jgi:hypothetical protein
MSVNAIDHASPQGSKGFNPLKKVAGGVAGGVKGVAGGVGTVAGGVVGGVGAVAGGVGNLTQAAGRAVLGGDENRGAAVHVSGPGSEHPSAHTRDPDPPTHIPVV